MIMIAATSSRATNVAYLLLISIHSYAVVILIGFFVAAGLLWLRYSEGKKWTNDAGFHPWGGPTAAIIYSIVCAFLLVAYFVPPTLAAPFSKFTTGIGWFVVPTVGLGAFLAGYAYYIGLQYVVPRFRKKVLAVEREAVLVKENGEWVQAAELVDASWVARPGPARNSAEAHGK